jgi:hypothetical protein
MNEAIVRCYSGHMYAQEPVSFVWDGRECTVTKVRSRRRVLDQDRKTTLVFVVDTAGGRFRLSYSEAEDKWSIQALQSS